MSANPHWSMNSCLVEMGLADYFSGHRQVRRVARRCAQHVAPEHKELLMSISRTKKASAIVNQTLENLTFGAK